MSKWKKAQSQMSDEQVEAWLVKVLGVLEETARSAPASLGFMLFEGSTPMNVAMPADVPKDQAVALVRAEVARRGSRGVLWWSSCWTSEKAAEAGAPPSEMDDAKAELIAVYEDRRLGCRAYRAPLGATFLLEGRFERAQGVNGSSFFPESGS